MRAGLSTGSHFPLRPPGQGRAETPRPSRTVRREPQAPDSEFLHLTLKVSGDLQGRMVEEGAGIQFVSADGTPVLGYDELHAYDSRGQALPARLALKGERLSLIVDDRAAVYPVTIDPLIFSKTKLTASDGATQRLFRNFCLCGRGHGGGRSASGRYGGGSRSAGSAYVFVRSGPNWIQQAKLTASDGADSSDGFGNSVSVDGDTVVVGAPEDETSAGLYYRVGSAYVFVRRGTVLDPASQTDRQRRRDSTEAASDGLSRWTGTRWWSERHGTIRLRVYDCWLGVCVRAQRDELESASQTDRQRRADDDFGYSVSVDGDTVVVGAPSTARARCWLGIRVRAQRGRVGASKPN